MKNSCADIEPIEPGADPEIKIQKGVAGTLVSYLYRLFH